MPPHRRRTVRGARVLVLAAAGGALGLLPSSTGETDPVALLAWLALLAPAAGYACGAVGAKPWPFGLAVPGTWASLVFAADVAAERDLPKPLWAAAAVAGLWGLGVAAGALGPRRVLAGAGCCLFAGLLVTGLPVQGGLSAGAPWARERPWLGRALLDLSPVVLVLECAGLDATHSHPALYARSGVEWFPRRPYRGPLAGSVLLLVGCVLGEALCRSSARRASDSPA